MSVLCQNVTFACKECKFKLCKIKLCNFSVCSLDRLIIAKGFIVRFLGACLASSVLTIENGQFNRKPSVVFSVTNHVIFSASATIMSWDAVCFRVVCVCVYL